MTHKRDWRVERPRCADAKRQSLYKAARQLGSEAAKLFNIQEFVKILSLLIKRKLFTLAPTGRESSRLNEVNYGYERGGKIYKNTDRATECVMTNIGEDLLKIPVGWAYQLNNEIFINFVKIARHSEDNDILSPKNLLKGLPKTFLSRPLRERRNFLANVSELRNFREGYNSKINKIICHSCIIREDLSLDAQDDENDLLIVSFIGMHRSYNGRSALLCRYETNSLANNSSTPSPAVLKLISIR